MRKTRSTSPPKSEWPGVSMMLIVGRASNRRLFGEDRNPALALEVVRIERALWNSLIGSEGARLAKHRIDQRGLAVVDVRDDRDIAQLSGFACHASGHPPRRAQVCERR